LAVKDHVCLSFHSFLADLFLHSYEAEFVQELLHKGEKKLAQSFNYKFLYIDDVLSLNNKNFSICFTPNISSGLVVKDTTDSPNSVSYLDLYVEHDINETLTTKLYDRHNDLTFLSLSILFSTVTSRHLLHMVFTYCS